MASTEPAHVNTERNCPECDAELPPNAPQGLCPRCLAKKGLEELAADEPARNDIQLERTGAMIGRYKLLQKIGEGGFGVVYMAEQVEPVQRKVALKIIKAGMDTKEVIARFEAERQAIALMDHPNIARALDAGATEAGRPYFVMELVHGIPITDYCDQSHLPTRERLQLFIKVCQAVQHAHQKGVIHRDLKPSNVLVTLHDGEPVPKVIDFGVAKALGQRLTEKTLFTAFHHLIGTPAYMSPEQAALSGIDIDTRADIYSLGVLLYELLTGVTPFDAETLRQAGLDEIRRMIRETEPPRPSTRLRTLGHRLVEVASQRQTEPFTLSKLVRGDLDWIVMKCLEKDRRRRYETVNGLAADIRRHFENEPIIARPPSNLYRLQKLISRNKVIFAAAGCLAISLVAGTMLFYRQWRRADQNSRVAIEKLHASYEAEAEANLLSGRPGRRFATLETIGKAAAIRPSSRLRREAITALSLFDARFIPLEEPPPMNALCVKFDGQMAFIAIGTPEGDVAVKRVADGSIVGVVPSGSWGLSAVHAVGSGGRYLSLETKRLGPVLGAVEANRFAFSVLEGLAPNAGFTAFAAVNSDRSVSTYHLDTARRTDFACQLASDMEALALDPTGHRLACATTNRLRIEIVELETGQVVTPFITPPQAVESAVWSSDGKWLATGCGGMACVWDTTSGRLLRTFRGHDGRIVALAFNQSATVLATSSWDDTTRLWDMLSGERLLALAGTSYQLQFSRDDRRLAYLAQAEMKGSPLGIVEITDSSEYRQLSTSDFGGRRRDESGAVAVSQDGSIIAAVIDGRVQLWDRTSHYEIGSIPDTNCQSVFFDPRQTSLFSSGANGLARWPLAYETTGGATTVLIGPRQELYPGVNDYHLFTSLSSNSRWIAIAVESQGVGCVVDLTAPEKRITLEKHSGLRWISISPSGKWVATGTWQGSGVKVSNAQNGNLMHEIREPTHAKVLFSPDERWLLTAGAAYSLWKTGTWEPGPPVAIELPNYFMGVSAFSPDSRLLAVAHGRSTVRLLEAATGKVLADFETPIIEVVLGIAFSPDSSELLELDNRGRIHIWNLRPIRKRLAAMNLDWDMPPYPDAEDTPSTPVRD